MVVGMVGVLVDFISAHVSFHLNFFELASPSTLSVFLLSTLTNETIQVNKFEQETLCFWSCLIPVIDLAPGRQNYCILVSAMPCR